MQTDQRYFLTNFPIQFDATCNGFQHLSLLTGDEYLAKHLNLTPSNWDKKPEDFYNFLALNLKDYFKDKYKEISEQLKNEKINLLVTNAPVLTNKKKDITERSKDSNKKLLEEQVESYKRLSEIEIHRKIIKKPAMTKIYNVSLFSMAQYIKDEFNYYEENNDK